MPDKLRRKINPSGQKIRPDQHTRLKFILKYLNYKDTGLEIFHSLSRQFKISKQLFSNDMCKLVRDGLVKDTDKNTNKFKHYELTDAGRNTLAEFEKIDKRLSKSIENPRYISQIRNPQKLKEFLAHTDYGFQQKKTLKHVEVYHGKIRGFSITVHVGSKPSIMVTPKPIISKELDTAKEIVETTINELLGELDQLWQFDLSIPRPTGNIQFTVSDEFAKNVMRHTGGSQVKFDTDKGKVSLDQSHGTEPRIEMDSMESMRDYLNIPDLVRNVEKRLGKIEETQTWFGSLIDKASIALAKNTDATNRLIEIFSPQVKTGQEQIKTMSISNWYIG